MFKYPINQLFLIFFTIILFNCESKLDKVEKYMTVGMNTEALNLVEIVIKKDPEDAKAHYLKGIVYLLKFSPGSAKSAFSKATLLDDSYLDKIGEAYLRAGKLSYENNNGWGKSYFKTAIEKDPDSKDEFSDYCFKKIKELSKASSTRYKAYPYMSLIYELDSDSHSKLSDVSMGMVKEIYLSGEDKLALSILSIAVKSNSDKRENAREVLVEISKSQFSQEEYNKSFITLDRAMEYGKEEVLKEDEPFFYYNIAKKDFGPGRYTSREHVVNSDSFEKIIDEYQEKFPNGKYMVATKFYKIWKTYISGQDNCQEVYTSLQSINDNLKIVKLKSVSKEILETCGSYIEMNSGAKYEGFCDKTIKCDENNPFNSNATQCKNKLLGLAKADFERIKKFYDCVESQECENKDTNRCAQQYGISYKLKNP